MQAHPDVLIGLLLFGHCRHGPQFSRMAGAAPFADVDALRWVNRPFRRSRRTAPDPTRSDANQSCFTLAPALAVPTHYRYCDGTETRRVGSAPPSLVEKSQERHGFKCLAFLQEGGPGRYLWPSPGRCDPSQRLWGSGGAPPGGRGSAFLSRATRARGLRGEGGQRSRGACRGRGSPTLRTKTQLAEHLMPSREHVFHEILRRKRRPVTEGDNVVEIDTLCLGQVDSDAC